MSDEKDEKEPSSIEPQVSTVDIMGKGMLRLERGWTRVMRMLIIMAFVSMGPLLLWVLSWRTTLIGENFQTILDLFKIWLGAIIGISTNVLQKE